MAELILTVILIELSYDFLEPRSLFDLLFCGKSLFRLDAGFSLKIYYERRMVIKNICLVEFYMTSM